MQKSVSERKIAALGPRGDDGFDRALADVLDRQQPEPDRVALDGELEARLVDVRHPDFDPQAATFGDRRGDLLRVVADGREDARHVLDRVVRLQVRRLVGDEPVARGVGLVEAVALEGLEGVEDRIDRLRPDASLGRLVDELLAHRAQDRGLLLADRVAERVRLRPAEAAERHGGGHDVLLVHEDPVRLVEVRLQERVEVRDRLQAVLAPDVRRDVVHRARPVERDHGRQVVDRGGPELADVAAHARRLELEDARRLARGEQLERPAVVERDAVEVDLDAAVLADEVDRPAKDREVGEAEEVELEQAERLDAVHLDLGHEPVRVGRLLEGHELGQRLAGDHDPGGMRGGVPGHALELLGEVDQAAHLRVGVDQLAERRGGLDRLVELDAERVRDRLGDPVDVAVAHAEDPPDVADRRPGEHRAERDDLGDVVLAVFLADVGDDLLAPAVLEVHVDVGHRHPVGVEEALEREAVEDRVDRRDAEGVGHDRARGAAPAGRLDALLAGEPDEVRHDEEVARVAHREDHAELVVEARLELRRDLAVAAGQAALALGPEPALGRLAVRHREVRDPQLAEGELEVDHLRDPAGVEDRLGLVREQGGHLGRRLHPELARLELHPVRRVEVVAGADAQQDILGLALAGVHVMQVIRDDEGSPDLRRQAEELLVEALLLGQAVVLELEVEVAAEDVPVLAGEALRRLPVVDLERPRDLAVEAGRQADEALAVLREVLPVDARLVVVAVDVGVGHEPAQVLVAGHVLREKDQVERLGVGLALAVVHRPTGDVRLHSDDRLDVLGGGRLVEGDGSVERAVVGQGDRIHPVRGGRVDDLTHPPEPVEKAELGVDVEVGEVLGRHRHRDVQW